MAKEPLRGTLIVSILRGNNLVNKDTGAQGLSDPYVKLIATSHDKKTQIVNVHTKTIDNSLNPIWNERFSVPIDADAPFVTLDFEVFDEDPFGSHDQMGCVIFELDSTFKFDKDQDYPLKPRKKEEVKGTLTITISYKKGQQIDLNQKAVERKESKKNFSELPNEAKQNMKEWRAAKDVFTECEEAKMTLLIQIYKNNFNGKESPVFGIEKKKFGGFLFEYQKSTWKVGADDISSIKWFNQMKGKDGDFINESKDIIEAICSFQTSKKSSYRDGYLNDPEGLFCEELKDWASNQLSILSLSKAAQDFIQQRVGYLEECLLVSDLFDRPAATAKETIQQVIVKVRRILKYRAIANIEKELSHEDATRAFSDLGRHLSGLIRSCVKFLFHVFRCETPHEILPTTDRLMLAIESDENIRQVLGDELKQTKDKIAGLSSSGTEGIWQTVDLREHGLKPTLELLDPAKLTLSDKILPLVFRELNSGVEEWFRGNTYIAYHFLRAHGLVLEAGRLFVVIEKAKNCAKTGGTLLVFGLANAQLNATLDSTKAIMDALKEEFNAVSKIAECCFEELVFANQATKERTEWIKHFKNVFPGINEINDMVKLVQRDVSEIKQTANSMSLYERFQKAADENKEFLNTADQFSQRMAAITGQPYVKPKPKELTADDTAAWQRLIKGE
jgi:hypothetical protein